MNFDNQDQAERRRIGFDFSAELVNYPDVTIESATMSATVVSGTDPNPSSILTGSVQVDGAQIFQMREGGVTGVTYKIRCEATLSDGQVLVRTGNLKLVRE